MDDGGSLWVNFLGFILKALSTKLGKILAFEDLSMKRRFTGFSTKVRVLIDMDKVLITDLLFYRYILDKIWGFSNMIIYRAALSTVS